MNENFEFSRQELINAFDKWNKDYLKEPDKFEDITAKIVASDQADLLLDYLTKNKNHE